MSDEIKCGTCGEVPVDCQCFNQPATQELAPHMLVQLHMQDRRKQHAYKRGDMARQIGWARVSPYYEDPLADAAWFAGYDNQPLPTLDAVLVPVLDAHEAEQKARG